MTYDTECTGNPVIDINRPISTQGLFFFTKGCISSVKINPTSRCLDFIQLFGIRRLADYDIVVEIRENDSVTNYPKGIPKTSDGLIGKVTFPYSNIPLTFGNINITLGLILPIANTTYWIVIYSSDFECNSSNLGENRYELSHATVDTNSEFTLYCPTTTPCKWDGHFTSDSWALATYKKTYVPPPPTGTLHFVVTSAGTPLEGVLISVDNIDKGKTNSSGILDVTNLTYGTSHSYTTSKSGYNSVSSSVILDSTPKTVPVSMTTGGEGGGKAGTTIGLLVVAGVATAILAYTLLRKK